mgnify:CR=1 FL=1
MSTVKGILLTILFFAAITAPFIWKIAQWNECRTMGFSVLYCIQHIL